MFGCIGMLVNNENSFLFYYRANRRLSQAVLYDVANLIAGRNILTFGALYGIIALDYCIDLNQHTKLIIH